MEPDKRSSWLRELDEECPYQVVLPRQQLTDDSTLSTVSNPSNWMVWSPVKRNIGLTN